MDFFNEMLRARFNLAGVSSYVSITPGPLVEGGVVRVWTVEIRTEVGLYPRTDQLEWHRAEWRAHPSMQGQKSVEFFHCLNCVAEWVTHGGARSLERIFGDGDQQMDQPDEDEMPWERAMKEGGFYDDDSGWALIHGRRPVEPNAFGYDDDDE